MFSWQEKDSLQKATIREIIRNMLSVLLKAALNGELDEGLGYSKYDYRNKETDNNKS